MNKSTKIRCIILFVAIIIIGIICCVLNKTCYIDIESYAIYKNREDICEIQVFLAGKKAVINDSFDINEFIDMIDSVPLVISSEEKIPVETTEKNCSICFYDVYAGQGNGIGFVDIYAEKYIQRSVDMKVFRVRNKDEKITSKVEMWLKKRGYEFNQN